MLTAKGFFKDSWEDWHNDINFSFTDDPRCAYNFIDKDLSEPVPQYMWNLDTDEELENVGEMCSYLNGSLILVEIKSVMVWEEVC